MRKLLYLFARLLGDLGAVRRGRVGRRIARRAGGKGLGRWMRSIFGVLVLSVVGQGCAMLLPQPNPDLSDLRETPCVTLDGRKFRTKAMCTIHSQRLWDELVRSRKLQK